jgi:hypothetical protein
MLRKNVVVFVILALALTACGGNKKFGSKALPVTYFDNFTYELPPLPAGIKAQSAYYEAQIEKWNKIFMDLRYYLMSNTVIIIYNDSNEIKYTVDNDEVNFKGIMSVMPVINFNTIMSAQNIVNIWDNICKTEGTSVWTSSVSRTNPFQYGVFTQSVGWEVTVGLYDSSGKRIGGYTKKFSYWNSAADSAFGVSDLIRPYLNYFIDNRESLLNEKHFYLGTDRARNFGDGESVRIPIKNIGAESGFTCKLDSIEWMKLPVGHVKEREKIMKDFFAIASLPPVMSYDDYVKEFSK